MNIIITKAARSDIDEIFDYIVATNPTAALKTIDTIEVKVSQLADFPALGRLGRVDNTRELVITGTAYIAVYRVDSRRNVVVILSVVHTARLWPDSFGA